MTARTRTYPAVRIALHSLVLLAPGVATPPARADFKIGAHVSAFSLETVDGETIELKPDDSGMIVLFGEERWVPKAFIVHLFQPDCLQCRAQLGTLKPIAERYRPRGAITLGIARRGTPQAARELARELDLPFPIAMGVGSDIAKQFAAGDTLGITDAHGVIRFAQVGYGEGDAGLWEQALDEFLAEKEVTHSGVDRERLTLGDRLPAIHLPSLRTDKPMSLVGEGDRLVFRDDAGTVSRPKAAAGFFSRY